ncbi:MAG: HesA/MoeB/ThiF family protein [Pirellulaceae bacterium]|nr:HesA/MoeB/ThiF family protein [Pirellulaceae bacterium]
MTAEPQPTPAADTGGPLPELTDQERAVYEWQMWVPGVGQSGQRRLKGTSVMISRLGGVGGTVAYQLAAAGVGKLVLAHAGNLQPSDLNRQLLMTHDWLGRPRIESVRRRLLELNPRLEIVAVGENVDAGNAEELLNQADIVVDCAPLFPERFAMNAAAVKQRKPLVECAMYELEAQLTTIVPGITPCLQCIYPTAPPTWTRQFPVFGAVAGSVACLAAMEVIKLACELGTPLLAKMLRYDLRTMSFHQLQLARRADCPICHSVQA